MGEGLSVMVEQSSDAILAAVIRGTPPVEQREINRNMLSEIQEKFDGALKTFQGDTTPFIVLRNRLEEGLDQHLRPEARKFSPMVWGVCTLVLLLIGHMIYQPMHTAWLWKTFVQDLRRQTGIVIIDYGKNGDGHFISGLKDPIGMDTDDILSAYPFPARRLSVNFMAYDSTAPELVLRRAEKMLMPPETVQLLYKGGGLTASGSASNGWIRFFRQRALTVTGVESIDTSGLKDNDATALESAIQSLSKIRITFPKESYTPEEGQEKVLKTAGLLIEEIQALSGRMGGDVKIVLYGHTDPSGTDAYNRHLSKDRADAILERLIAMGIVPSGLSTIGITGEGTAARFVTRTQTEEAETKRRVTFKVYHTTSNTEFERK
jgi:OOP family OmpA-OmpF porin